MHWSFGFVVMLVCLLILLACFAVKLLFKRGMRLRAVRARGKDRGAVVTVRTPLTTTDEAQRSAEVTGLPRALMRTSGPLPDILVVLGVVGWLCWRVLVSRHHVLDTWIVWTFDVLFVVVAVQLVLAGFEGRVVGRGEVYRVAVLVPLYNEDALRPAEPELSTDRDSRRRRRLHPVRLCGAAGLVHPPGGGGPHLRHLAAHRQ